MAQSVQRQQHIHDDVDNYSHVNNRTDTVIASQVSPSSGFNLSYKPGINSAVSNSKTESIALDSFSSRGPESLKRIHAQSSAETSGIGDSLQRIHAFSSTETSGYGDGDLYCGSPSPEYTYYQHHGLGFDPHHQQSVGGPHSSNLELRHKKPSPEFSISSSSAFVRKPRSNNSGACGEFMRAHSTESKKTSPNSFVNSGSNQHQLRINTSDTDRCSSHSSNRRQGYRRVKSCEEDPGAVVGYPRVVIDPDNNKKQHHQHKKDYSPTKLARSNVDPTLDSFIDKRENTKMSIDVEVRGLTGSGRHSDVNDNNNAATRGASGIKKSGSLTSLGSNKGNGFFLGRNTKSTWMTWSQDRRASFKRRIQSMEERQKELEENRVSTPVLKARKESVMFVSPGFAKEPTLPSEEDLIVHERLQSYVPSSKARRRTEEKDEIKLSPYQWNALVTYWEHPMFIKCRWGGIFLASCALVLTIICLTNQQWSVYPDHDFYGASHSGLWLICSSSVTKNCTTVFERSLLESCIPPQQPLPPGNYSPPNSACHKIKPWLDEDNSSGHWQYAVIGLLIFSVAFGFLATMLAFCGICTAALPRKLYYYHSAGEIFFICALAVLAAVLIYPVAMESESKVTAHQYGHGYILTWVAVFIFLASSLCMCLDEIMRTITKACLSIQRRRGNSRV